MATTQRRRPPLAVIIILVVALLGGGAWWWWSSTQSSSATASTYSGSVEADQYQIVPALAGRITAITVAEGDQVKTGQVIARLDTAALTLQKQQAQQGVTAAKAALTNARNDGTSADVRAAKAKVKQAEAAVKLAEVQLGYTKVTAPRAGVVTSVSANAGENAAPGKTMATIIDPTSLFVRIFVPETQIGTVKIGQSAQLSTDSTPSVGGTVSFIASQSEFTPNTVQTRDQRVKLVYEVRVRVNDPSTALKAGMPVDVALG